MRLAAVRRPTIHLDQIHPVAYQLESGNDQKSIIKKSTLKSIVADIVFNIKHSGFAIVIHH